MGISGADILITHATVITMDEGRRILHDAAVSISDGAIADIGPSADLEARFPAAETIDAAGAIVHPGFVDAHAHLSQHLGRSTIPDRWPEAREHDQWLPYWLNLTEADDHLSSLLGALEMARNGTTTFCDLGGRHRAELNAGAAAAVGLRGLVSEICWDRPPHPDVGTGDTAECLRRLERQLVALPRDGGARVFAGVGLPGMGTASDELLVGAMALARQHGVVCYFHQSFADADVSAYLAQTGGSSAVAHLAELGILGPDLTLIHMVHAEEDEVALLSETGTNVVHCPAASIRSAVGASRFGRFPEMAAAGVNVALGSDSGNYSDAFDIGRQAYLAATIHAEARGEPAPITSMQALEMATIGGATALGLADQIGSLEVGKRADIVVREYAHPSLRPGLDPVKTLVYGAQSAGVAAVLVDGMPIVRDGRVVTVDETTAYREIDAAARSLYERMGVPDIPIP